MKSQRGSGMGGIRKAKQGNHGKIGGDFDTLGLSVQDSETLDQSKLVHQEFLNVIALHPDPLMGRLPASR